MLWIWIVIASQFGNAGAMLLDKFLLVKKFPKASVLTFWTCVWNLLGLVFIAYDFDWQPGSFVIWVSILSGALFTVALQFFYVAMKKGEASHIGPLVGGVVPIVTMVISYFWLAERLTFYQFVGVILLVVGVLIISFEKSRKHNGWHIGMLWAVVAGIFFALTYVTAKAVYMETTFSTGFVWARLGCFVAALPLLLVPSIRKAIFVKDKKEKEKRRSGLVILVINKTLASLYYVGMHVAVSMASATLVNALAGLQYAVLFVLIYFSTIMFPKFFKETFTKVEIIQEIFAILLIIGGLIFIVL